MSSIFTIDYSSIVKEVSEHKNLLVKSEDSRKLASELVYLVGIRYKLLNDKINSCKLTVADLKVRINEIEKLIKQKNDKKNKNLKGIEVMMMDTNDRVNNNFEGLGESIVNLLLYSKLSDSLLKACNIALNEIYDEVNTNITVIKTFVNERCDKMTKKKEIEKSNENEISQDSEKAFSSGNIDNTLLELEQLKVMLNTNVWSNKREFISFVQEQKEENNLFCRLAFLSGYLRTTSLEGADISDKKEEEQKQIYGQEQEIVVKVTTTLQLLLSSNLDNLIYIYNMSNDIIRNNSNDNSNDSDNNSCSSSSRGAELKLHAFRIAALFPSSLASRHLQQQHTHLSQALQRSEKEYASCMSDVESVKVQVKSTKTNLESSLYWAMLLRGDSMSNIKIEGKSIKEILGE